MFIGTVKTAGLLGMFDANAVMTTESYGGVSLASYQLVLRNTSRATMLVLMHSMPLQADGKFALITRIDKCDFKTARESLVFELNLSLF